MQCLDFFHTSLLCISPAKISLLSSWVFWETSKGSNTQSRCEGKMCHPTEEPLSLCPTFLRKFKPLQFSLSQQELMLKFDYMEVMQACALFIFGGGWCCMYCMWAVGGCMSSPWPPVQAFLSLKVVLTLGPDTSESSLCSTAETASHTLAMWKCQQLFWNYFKFYKKTLL